MFIGVQFLGILFSLVMIYFTFLYFKKGNYDIKYFTLWILIWVAFLVLVAFPATIYGIMDIIGILNTADFFVILGFLFFSVAIFHMFTITKQNEQKLDYMVRKLALRDGRTKKKK